MEKFLGQDIPENERWQFLQDNADAVEEIGYTHRFHPKNWHKRKNFSRKHQSKSITSRKKRKRH